MTRRPGLAAISFVTRSALDLFRRLPRRARRLLTRLGTPNYTVGAVAVVRDDAGRVLLLRTRQHHGWSLPGGLLRRGERPVDGLARELAEEIGVDVPAATLAALPEHTFLDARTQQVTVVIELALTSEPQADGVEVIEMGWFGLDEIPSTLVTHTLDHLRVAGLSVRAIP